MRLTNQPTQQPYRDPTLANFILGVCLCLEECEKTIKPCITIYLTPNMHTSSSSPKKHVVKECNIYFNEIFDNKNNVIFCLLCTILAYFPKGPRAVYGVE